MRLTIRGKTVLLGTWLVIVWAGSKIPAFWWTTDPWV